MLSADPEVLAGLLRTNATAYARVAMSNLDREYPADVWQVLHGPDDPRPRPTARNPVFHGALDWHSSVEMAWVLARLLRIVPDAIPSGEVRTFLDARLSADGLAAEADFIAHPDNRNRERPYGWGWALALAAEVEALGGGDGERWGRRLAPLVAAVAGNFLDWLPPATYPVRYGVHSNSAFGLSLALPFARARRAAGEPTLADAIEAAARRWFAADRDGPGAWEPSGFDFLSPVLVEAELMASLFAPGEFAGWLAAFLPGLAEEQPPAIFAPVIVSDSSDPHIAHLHGLNASRAWCWRRIAATLPAGDPRIEVAARAMARHAEAALPHVVGDDYMVEHWLAAYAVLLLS